MNLKIKSKSAICVLISLLSLMLLIVCGMAMLGGEFFTYVGKGFHFIYTFLTVRQHDWKTWGVIGIAILSICSAVYWLYVAFKSESVELYELVAPVTSLLMPFIALSAYRGASLGIWDRGDKPLVVLALIALVIYVISSLGALIYSFSATSKKRKAAKKAIVDIVEEPAEEQEPVVVEKVVEKVVYVEKEPEEPEEPVEEVEEEVVVEVAGAKKKVIRRPFAEKMAKASTDIKDTYNILKNELLSYGVKSRISHGSDTFRLRKQEYAKITLVGKNLKLYVATKPQKYDGTTIPVRDEGSKKCFAETPTMIKVKSTLSVKRAKMMIADLMAERGLTQGEVENVNYARQLKAKKARVAKK
ncbi:MAG: hypothetical protein J1F31_03825 [Erysipelotrichales bacterium]|nr:hypothetical protein [Erysipelotrichales bacterium]